MFTGIIEATGIVKQIASSGDNLVFTIQTSLSSTLQVDQSVAHNGVCLTVIEAGENNYQVEAVEETLRKTNLKQLKAGDTINIERALTMDKRLDGHLVQGHVDAVGICEAKTEKNGSTLFTISFPGQFAALVIEKGSIAVNGVSLTAFDVANDRFTVSVIPHTFSHTTLNELETGMEVNLEFDLIGKYALRQHELETDKSS